MVYLRVLNTHNLVSPSESIHNSLARLRDGAVLVKLVWRVTTAGDNGRSKAAE